MIGARSANVARISLVATALLIQPVPAQEGPVRLPPTVDWQNRPYAPTHIHPATLPFDLSRDDAGDFPPPPHDPESDDREPLRGLDEELRMHGGSSLYATGAGILPEDWQSPQPLTAFSQFLGTGPIRPRPRPLNHLTGSTYVWEPRLVGYGQYDLFCQLLRTDGKCHDLAGHQLRLELDLRLTGTERFHVQLRPLGRDNTGGSYYRWSEPDGYVSHHAGEPTRYWFEFELHSLLGAVADPFGAFDYHVVLGKFPFALHNTLLINDELLGVVVNKNTIISTPLSNLNVQCFAGLRDVDAFENADASLFGMHASGDYARNFYEATWAYVPHDRDSARDSYFAALSRTSHHGAFSWAGRAMCKFGDERGRGSGQLFVLESNVTRLFDHQPLSIEHGVFYCNAFLATRGWNSVGGSNFNRLRSAFEVNPLIRLTATPNPDDTFGVAAGVQLFRRQEDESIVPELAFERRAGENIWGGGLKYLRKTSRRSYLELLALVNHSRAREFRRSGVFGSHSVLW